MSYKQGYIELLELNKELLDNHYEILREVLVGYEEIITYFTKGLSMMDELNNQRTDLPSQLFIKRQEYRDRLDEIDAMTRNRGYKSKKCDNTLLKVVK